MVTSMLAGILAYATDPVAREGSVQSVITLKLDDYAAVGTRNLALYSVRPVCHLDIRIIVSFREGSGPQLRGGGEPNRVF
jgi:hypothetical protein